jgi:hypothetical protein
MAGGGSSIPVRGRLGSAGKGRGSGVGSPRVPFRGLLAAEEQPTAVLGDAGGLWPQGASAPTCWSAMLRNRQLGRLQQGCGEVEDETNRISANGNPTLCTSVIVPGKGYHVQSLSQVVQIHTTRE